MKVNGMKDFTMDRGFTILEVLIAMTLLSIAILGIAGLAGTAIRSSGYSQAITQANNLAQDRIEALQSVDFSNFQATDTATARTDLRRTCTGPTGPASRPVYSCTPSSPTLALGTKNYTWSYTVTYIDLNGNGAANPNIDNTKRLDVTISWTDPMWHTQKSLSVVTIRSRG